MDTIINKVSESGIITLDLVKYLADDSLIAAFDLKPFLFREMILKEKDYRTQLQSLDWNEYTGKHVALYCSTDAIIPVWAYMLAASYLQPIAASVYFGNIDELKKQLTLANLAAMDISEYDDKRMVIKGCGDVHVPDYAYVAVTDILRPVAKSIMYGEPCSTVPVYKKPKS